MSSANNLIASKPDDTSVLPQGQTTYGTHPSSTSQYIYDPEIGQYVDTTTLCGGKKPHNFVNIGFHFDKYVCSECGKDKT